MAVVGAPRLDGADPWLILALAALFAVAAMGCVGSTGPLLEGPVDADDAIDAGAVTRGGGCPLPLPEKNF